MMADFPIDPLSKATIQCVNHAGSSISRRGFLWDVEVFEEPLGNPTALTHGSTWLIHVHPLSIHVPRLRHRSPDFDSYLTLYYPEDGRGRCRDVEMSP